jgi:hypothetical protein
VAANENLKEEISQKGLRKTTKETGLDRKTIRGILKGKKVKAATLAKVVMGLHGEEKADLGAGTSKSPKKIGQNGLVKTAKRNRAWPQNNSRKSPREKGKSIISGHHYS